MAAPPPPQGKTLFTVPVEACDKHPGGSITVTEPAPQVYLLTIASPPDNRQTSAFCRALLHALDLVEHSGLPAGCVVTTSAIPKFYSNGLDLEHAVSLLVFVSFLSSLYVHEPVVRPQRHALQVRCLHVKIKIKNK